MQRPEIIEFRGQYFYGPRPGEPLDGPLTPAGSSMDGIRYPPYGRPPMGHQHHHSYPGDELHASGSSPYQTGYYGDNNHKFKGMKTNVS